MTDLLLREHAADRLRGSLLTGISELDRRRRRLSPEAIGSRARESTVVRGVVVLLGAGVAGGALALAYFLRRRNRPTERLRRHMRARRDALVRLWREPDRIARSAQPPLPAQLGRKVLLIAVTALATTASKRTSERLIPGR